MCDLLWRAQSNSERTRRNRIARHLSVVTESTTSQTIGSKLASAAAACM
jgi:hypothetical protein